MRLFFFLALIMVLPFAGRAQGDCAPSIKIDEFEYVSVKDAAERIDLFGIQVRNSNAYGYVVGYGGRKTESNEGRTIAVDVAEYLNSKFDFKSYVTITHLNGGHRERKSVELFLKMKSCGIGPEVSPTLTPDEVTYFEEKEFFKNCYNVLSSSELRDLVVQEIEPVYPAAPRAVRAKGKVIVLIAIDETGKVISAKAIEGHPLLRAAAENTLRKYVFDRLVVKEKAVKYGGKFVLDYDKYLEDLESRPR